MAPYPPATTHPSTPAPAVFRSSQANHQVLLLRVLPHRYLLPSTPSLSEPCPLPLLPPSAPLPSAPPSPPLSPSAPSPPLPVIHSAGFVQRSEEISVYTALLQRLLKMTSFTPHPIRKRSARTGGGLQDDALELAVARTSLSRRPHRFRFALPLNFRHFHISW